MSGLQAHGCELAVSYPVHRQPEGKGRPWLAILKTGKSLRQAGREAGITHQKLSTRVARLKKRLPPAA